MPSNTPNLNLIKPSIGATNWGNDVNANWDTLDTNLPKSNFSASVAPAAGNDSTQGYAVGSRWFDTTHVVGYVCVDASVGAAVWVSLSGGSGTPTDAFAFSWMGF